MQRVTIGLGVATSLLLLGSVWLWRENTRLTNEVVALRAELSTEQAKLEAAQEIARNAVTGGARAKVQRPAARPTRRPVRRPDGLPGPGAAGAGRPSPERIDEVRQSIRSRALDRMLLLIEQTGQSRGWDGATIAEVQAILEESFYATGDAREQVREGEAEPDEAREEVDRVREQREADLIALLGDEEYAALTAAMRAPAR